MKKSSAIILALVLVLSSCSPASTVSSGVDFKSSESESVPEYEDIYAKKIAKNRKKVYETLENCDNILDIIPNPATVDTIPVGDISVYTGEELPDCIVNWAYKYFSYMVTGNVYEDFDRTSQEAQVLRFLAAKRRVDGTIADTIEISANKLEISGVSAGELSMYLSALFYCTPYKYNESIEEYETIPNTEEKIYVFFSLFKEDGEWAIEYTKLICGDCYDYANACKNKTQGRFPEVDKYDIVDYTICEYAEKLYDFGVCPLRADL